MKKRTFAFLIGGIAVIVVALLVAAGIGARTFFDAITPYNGVLIHVHNDTKFTVQLECEYTHNPRIKPGEAKLASFEPHLRNSGCGVIRVSDKKVLGCVTVDPEGTGAIDGSSVNLSTNLDSKMRCYNEG
jgi:hypothetical protein